MSDPTPRTTICPDCHALIPREPDDMRAHRTFHNDLKMKHDGVRKRINEQDDKITRAIRAADDAHHAADNIHIPTPPPPLEISDAEDEWANLPDYEPTPTEEQTTSTYIDDNAYTATAAPTPTYTGTVFDPTRTNP